MTEIDLKIQNLEAENRALRERLKQYENVMMANAVMSRQKCIKGLESLKDHCASMIDKSDPDSIWRHDVEALDTAIEIIRQGLQSGSGEYLTEFKVREDSKLPPEKLYSILKKIYPEDMALEIYERLTNRGKADKDENEEAHR